ncbi:FHA domain-containing protein [Flavonifractor sp. An100]|uniref:FHA domain-containing protein n=1 Tax=Flavonifractor sp. An100 TaxID=1965538 RepID=UPI000B572FAA|nr:FHA domain-containing protein [Flavonifractor sp. An100]OUQ74806.1 hypothetical protein B5E43_14505 [Flavonifractor sp. An100]
MKRALALLLTGLLAALTFIPVSAAGSAELVRTFFTENTLYTYVSLEGADQPITQAEARIGSQSFPAAGTLATVQQAGFPVTYLLLVDNSTSMPAYRQELVSFGQQLAQLGGEHTQFLLATFGNDLSITEEALSAEELGTALEQLSFHEEVTRLHSCLDKALDYFEALPRESNELRCMVILSDAVQYDPDGGIPYDELLERLSRSDVMLHSVGVGQQEDALESLGQLAQASGGTHQTVKTPDEAEEAAQQLSSINGSMLVLGFDLSGCSASGEGQNVSVTFASNGALVCKGESTVDLPSDQPEAPSPAVSTPLPPSNNSTSLDAKENTPQPSSSPLLPLVGAAVVILLVGGAVIILKRRSSSNTPPASPPPQGIYMRIEDPAGHLAGTETGRYLTQELLVGRDPSCDILFQDPSVSRRHARIFLANGTVYLEDLGSQNGTTVNGNPIHMPCALRSGDTLTTGEVTWMLKF